MNASHAPISIGNGRIRAGLRLGQTSSSIRPAATMRAALIAATRSFAFMQDRVPSKRAPASSTGRAVSIP